MRLSLLTLCSLQLPAPPSLCLVVSLHHGVPESTPWLWPPRISPSFLLRGAESPDPRCWLSVTGSLSPAGLWGQGPRAPVRPRQPPGHPAPEPSDSLGPPRGGRGLLPGDQCFAAANWVSGPPRGGGLGTRAGRGSGPGRGAGRPGGGERRGGRGGWLEGKGLGEKTRVGNEVGIYGQFPAGKRGLGTDTRDKKEN